MTKSLLRHTESTAIVYFRAPAPRSSHDPALFLPVVI